MRLEGWAMGDIHPSRRRERARLFKASCQRGLSVSAALSKAYIDLSGCKAPEEIGGLSRGPACPFLPSPGGKLILQRFPDRRVRIEPAIGRATPTATTDRRAKPDWPCAAENADR